MTQLYFIRHGETEANVRGVLTGTLETNLTQKGLQDARNLSKELTEDFDAYYCSPLKRTHETLLAIKGKINFVIDERLNEVFSGNWQGKMKTELPQEEYMFYKQGLLCPPGGETLKDVDNRIVSFLRDMFKKYTHNQKILICTHNAFMRQLKRLFLNDNEGVEPKNLEIFKVTDEMFKKLMESERK